MNADNFQFLATVLINLNDASANWQEIATASAITRKDNAQSKFKNMIKKIGLEYDGKKFGPIDGFDGGNLVAATPKKTATSRKRKDDEDTPNSSSPTKKRAIKISQKVEALDADDSESDLKGTKAEAGPEASGDK